MFVKRVAKHTLGEIFEEDKMIEFQMKGCKEDQISLIKKETKPLPKRGLLLTRPPRKKIEQGPEKEGGDLEKLQRMIKKTL
jgi:hypothetical protein